MRNIGWMMGQNQQCGPSQQSSLAATQITQNTLNNQQTGTANNAYQQSATYTIVQSPQLALFTFGNGASNGQMSSGQTSTVHYQAAPSLQPTGGKSNSHLKALHGNLQNSSVNTQSGNPSMFQNFKLVPQKSAQNSSTHRQPVTMTANTTNNQQNTANWSPSVTSVRLQNDNALSNLQHRSHQRNLYQIVNGAIIPTATWLPPTTAACNRTLGNASAQNVQTAPNQHHRQNSTQHALSPSKPPPPYTLSQSYRNITTNSPSSGQGMHISSMSQQTQQYSTKPNLTPNSGQTANSSINSNSYQSRQYEMRLSSNTNELPLNLAPGVQQQMLRPQMHQSFANSHFQSVTAGSDARPLVHTSSPHNRKQFDNRMMESYPAQYNSNTRQSASHHFSPKTTQSVTLATQHVADELNKPMQQPEHISPPKKSHSSVASNPELLEILEMLTSGSPNTTSIHSSPGRMGLRAVAVVQPLAQECCQVDNKHSSFKTNNQECECNTTGDSPDCPEKLISPPEVAKNTPPAHFREVSNVLTDDCRFPQQNPDRFMASKSPIKNSATSDNSAVVLSSDSAGPPYAQQPLSIDQTIPPVAQQLTPGMPESQNGSEKRSSDAEAYPCDLSSLPTDQWRGKALIEMVKTIEETEMKSDVLPEFNSTQKLLSMYWEGSCKMLAAKLRSGWYKNLINEVHEFSSKHLTYETVILSQVKSGFEKQLKDFHVMADNEVYSALPCKSSWLNTNEQLDDIDKEFGFPWSLKNGIFTFDSNSQPDQVEAVETINSIPENEVQNKTLLQTKVTPLEADAEKHSTVDMPPENEPQNKTLLQTKVTPIEADVEKHSTVDMPPENEPQNKTLLQTKDTPVEADAEKHSTVDMSPTQAASPNKCADSSDSFLSFEIHVLPPEEAKMIFEQIQNKMPHSTEPVCQPEKVTDSPVEDTDVAKSDSKLGGGAATPLEQICCIERWKQIILGSDMTSSSPCQCKTLQIHEDSTHNTTYEEEEDCKLLSVVVGESQVKGCENTVNQIQNFILPELCDEVSQTIDLTDSDDKPPQVSNNNSPQSTNSSSSSIVFISDDRNEILSSSEDEIPNQMPSPEEKSEQGHRKPTESMPSTGSHNSEKVSSSSVVTATHCDDDYGQSQLTSTNEAESSLTTTQQTSVMDTSQTFSRNHKSVDPHSQQLPEGISKCRNVSVADDSENLVSNVRTAELVLFGSASQERGSSAGPYKSNRLSPSCKESKPPEVLTVRLSPFKRKYSETTPAREYSVKRWIHENWRKYFQPTRMKHRSKQLKIKKYALSEVTLKKAQRSGLTNTEELPAPSETRNLNGNSRRCLSLKRRRSLSDGLKLGEKKAKKDAVTLNSTVCEKNKPENESQTVEPLQESLVLKFSVLPNTFSFEDTSIGLKEATDNVSDKAELVGTDDESPSVPAKKARGTWYPNPEKKYIPLHTSSVQKQYNALHPSPVNKTSSVFQEYQKKYTKKIQPSMEK